MSAVAGWQPKKVESLGRLQFQTSELVLYLIPFFSLLLEHLFQNNQLTAISSIVKSLNITILTLKGTLKNKNCPISRLYLKPKQGHGYHHQLPSLFMLGLGLTKSWASFYKGQKVKVNSNRSIKQGVQIYGYMKIKFPKKLYLYYPHLRPPFLIPTQVMQRFNIG